MRRPLASSKKIPKHRQWSNEPVRRVQKFRSDYIELRNLFEKLKTEAFEQVCSIQLDSRCHSFLSLFQQAASQRAELINASGTPNSLSDTRRRFQTSTPPSTLHPDLRPTHVHASEQVSESPFRSLSPYANHNREFRALDEHSFIQNTENRLDEFLAQGRAVLDNLVDQKKMLKGTHKRLLDTANTLGLSRQVIGWIERRRFVCYLVSITRRSVLTTRLPALKMYTSSLAVPYLRFFVSF